PGLVKASLLLPTAPGTGQATPRAGHCSQG
ncbi:hypothetical protein A2U01_0097470, partial [Trifolium medium]|nr:hypothetical protein [Trifolium medium]